MRSLSLALAMLMFLIGCDGPQGVHIGNGMRSYNSQLGFSFNYNESLNITESTRSGNLSIAVSNANIAQAQGTDPDRVSRFDLQVRPKLRAQSLFDLQRIALQEEPGKEYKILTLNNSTVLKHVEPRNDDILSISYYFVTTAKAVVKATVFAFNESRGKELIGGIGESYSGGKAPKVMRAAAAPGVEVMPIGPATARGTVLIETHGLKPRQVDVIEGGKATYFFTGKEEEEKSDLGFAIIPHDLEAWGLAADLHNITMFREREAIALENEKNRKKMWLVHVADGQDLIIFLETGRKGDHSVLLKILNSIVFGEKPRKSALNDVNNVKTVDAAWKHLAIVSEDYHRVELKKADVVELPALNE